MRCVSDIVESVERQKKLSDFGSILVKYFPLIKDVDSWSGRSERVFSRLLKKQGYQVWRGGLIHRVRNGDIYPAVRRKYLKLCWLLDKYVGRDVRELLQYFCHVHHGMPDFICFRNKEFKFVECKAKYEQLSIRQRLCIARLQQLGFVVEIYSLVGAATKVRRALLDVYTNEKRVIERDMTVRVYD